jgi:hypothetical protein
MPVKGKLSRYRHASAKGYKRYSSYSFLTSALEGTKWSASRSGHALPRETTPCTNWTGCWVGLKTGLDTDVRGRIFCLSGDRTPVTQSVDRHYTDWATPAPVVMPELCSFRTELPLVYTLCRITFRHRWLIHIRGKMFTILEFLLPIDYRQRRHTSKLASIVLWLNAKSWWRYPSATLRRAIS